MNNDILEKARKNYIHGGVETGNENWEEISGRLSSQNLPVRTYVTKVAVILLIPLVILSGVVGVSAAAKPGELLFPVKVASEKITTKLKEEFEIKYLKKENSISNPNGQSRQNNVTEVEKPSEEEDTEENKPGISASPISDNNRRSERAPEQNGNGQSQSQNNQEVKGLGISSEAKEKVNDVGKGKSEENKGRGKGQL